MADDENNTEGPSSRGDPQEAEESSPRRGTPSYYYRQLYNSYRRFRNYASDDPWIVHYLIFACYLGVYAISPSFLKSTYFREMTYRTSILTILQTTINVHRGYDRFDQLRMLGLVLIALCLKDMFRAVGFEFCAHFAGLERCSRWFNWVGAVAPSPVDPNRPPFTWLLMATAVFTAIELAILGYLAYSRRIGLVRRIFALWAVVAVAETGMSAIRMGNKWTRQRVTVAVPIW